MYKVSHNGDFKVLQCWLQPLMVSTRYLSAVCYE